MIERKIRALSRMLVMILIVQLISPAVIPKTSAGGTVEGAVIDPNKAVIVGATVTLENIRTGYKNTVQTDEKGAFRFTDIPPNPYALTVSASGFAAAKQVIDVRSSVPLVTSIPLQVSGSAGSVDVTSKYQTY